MGILRYTHRRHKRHHAEVLQLRMFRSMKPTLTTDGWTASTVRHGSSKGPGAELAHERKPTMAQSGTQAYSSLRWSTQLRTRRALLSQHCWPIRFDSTGPPGGTGEGVGSDQCRGQREHEHAQRDLDKVGVRKRQRVRPHLRTADRSASLLRTQD